MSSFAGTVCPLWSLLRIKLFRWSTSSVLRRVLTVRFHFGPLFVRHFQPVAGTNIDVGIDKMALHLAVASSEKALRFAVASSEMALRFAVASSEMTLRFAVASSKIALRFAPLQPRGK